MPLECPDDVQAIARRYFNGTTDYNRYRIHAWTDRFIWVSAPGGSFWSAVGCRSYGAVWHRILPRDIAKVSCIRGEVFETRGRVAKSRMLETMQSL